MSCTNSPVGVESMASCGSSKSFATTAVACVIWRLSLSASTASALAKGARRPSTLIAPTPPSAAYCAGDRSSKSARRRSRAATSGLSAVARRTAWSAPYFARNGP
jgi:hypothetical protein